MIGWSYAFIDRPMSEFGRARDFWAAVTGTRPSPPRGAEGEFVTLLPAGADACVKMQGVHDAGGAHLDLAVADVPPAEEAARGLGATMIAPHPDWAVLRSPAGQPFCLVRTEGEAVRPPVVVDADATSSRLDQVCLDIAPSRYDAEVAFWQELTGWQLRSSPLPEFTLLVPPAGLPIRILLQRLDTERASGAHIDLACSDPEAVRARHERLGARRVGRHPGRDWLVMADPAGGMYCLTARDPATGDGRTASA